MSIHFRMLNHAEEARAMSEEKQSYSEGDFTRTAVVGLIVIVVTFGAIVYSALTNPALDTLKY